MTQQFLNPTLSSVFATVLATSLYLQKRSPPCSSYQSWNLKGRGNRKWRWVGCTDESMMTTLEPFPIFLR
jgi:hypothetical protein